MDGRRMRLAVAGLAATVVIGGMASRLGPDAGPRLAAFGRDRLARLAGAEPVRLDGPDGPVAGWALRQVAVSPWFPLLKMKLDVTPQGQRRLMLGVML